MSEFHMNAYSACIDYSYHSVAGLSNGNFVVTWQTGDDVYGQIFTASGVKSGSEFQIKENVGVTFACLMLKPVVTGLINGNFVVTYREGKHYADGKYEKSGYGASGQIFTESGAKSGSEFQISPSINYRGGDDSPLSLTGLCDGNFVVTWPRYGQVYGQIFTESGAKSGSEFQINTYTDDNQRSPSVTGLSNCNFVVAWQSGIREGNGQDGSTYGIYGQIFIESGAKSGSEFQINTYTDDSQKNPSVTGLRNGNFVVTWQSDGQDGSGYGVYGQIFTASGARSGSEFQINTYTDSSQSYPCVTGLSNGNFVVTWQSDGQDGSGYGVYRQIFTASGARSGSEFQINAYTDSRQLYLSVTGLSNGNFVVTWQSDGQDGSDYGVYGEVFSESIANDRSYQSDVSDMSEFQINTYTDSSQSYPCVKGLSNGNFVVTWQSDGQDGSGYGVYGQIFAASGARSGSEFQINTYTDSSQSYPCVTGLSNGNFVVTWQSDGQDGSGYGVYGQIFTPSGARSGSEFQINTYTDSSQLYPCVTGLSNGKLVVTWQSDGQDGSGYGVYGQIFTGSAVYGKMFTATSAKSGSEFQINTYDSRDQDHPSVTGLSNGNFVVTWQSWGQDGGSYFGVYGQIFSASGAKSGSEFQINTYDSRDQDHPSVTGLSNGNFVVTWTSEGQDGSGYGVYGQIFTASGAKSGSEFQINTYTDSYQGASSMTGLSNGNFVVTWQSDGQDGSGPGVYGQIFTASGVQSGSEFQINTYTDSHQYSPSVTGLSNGNFVVTWTSYGQDGLDKGVYGKVLSESIVKNDGRGCIIKNDKITDKYLSISNRSHDWLITQSSPGKFLLKDVDKDKYLTAKDGGWTDDSSRYTQSPETGSYWNIEGNCDFITNPSDNAAVIGIDQSYVLSVGAIYGLGLIYADII